MKTNIAIWGPVIVDVKLQNLKANHNPPHQHRRPSLPVIVDVKFSDG